MYVCVCVCVCAHVCVSVYVKVLYKTNRSRNNKQALFSLHSDVPFKSSYQKSRSSSTQTPRGGTERIHIRTYTHKHIHHTKPTSCKHFVIRATHIWRWPHFSWSATTTSIFTPPRFKTEWERCKALSRSFFTQQCMWVGGGELRGGGGVSRSNITHCTMTRLGSVWVL